MTKSAREIAEKCFPNKSLFSDAQLMWEIIGNMEQGLKEYANQKLDEAAMLARNLVKRPVKSKEMQSYRNEQMEFMAKEILNLKEPS